MLYDLGLISTNHFFFINAISEIKHLLGAYILGANFLSLALIFFIKISFLSDLLRKYPKT